MHCTHYNAVGVWEFALSTALAAGALRAALAAPKPGLDIALVFLCMLPQTSTPIGV